MDFIAVPIELIKETPNDQELGAKVRALLNQTGDGETERNDHVY